MDDNKLMKFSFILALLGIAGIFILADKLDLKNSDINGINDKIIEKNIKIKGYVEIVKSNSVVQIVTIKDDTGVIDVILYGKARIVKGSLIEVNGRVSKYENKLQVNADSIKVLS